MALDSRTLNKIERLLKDGKTKAGANLLTSLADVHSRDILTLNRIGDLLSKGGQPEDAVRCYSVIAEHFSQGGFFPKAVAIYKKVLKLEPESAATLEALGEVYLRQQHMGEAQRHLTNAADRYLAVQDFASARSVYRQLVDADPGNPGHRVRLAETLAAEGESAAAGAQLLELGATLLEGDRPQDAEKAYSRAAELLDDEPRAICGLAMSLAGQQRTEEAVRSLEEQINGKAAHPAIGGALAVLYDLSSRDEDTERLLRDSISLEVLEQYVRGSFSRPDGPSRIAEPWKRVDRILEGWGPTEGAASMLERLIELESSGHLPAVERVYRCRKAAGDGPKTTAAGQRLIEAYRSRSMHAEAARFARELTGAVAGELRPSEADSPAEAPAPTPAPTSAAEPVPSSSSDSPAGGELLDAETPAVPITPVDHEFVSGHLTEAEVLQKYGLGSEAMQRLRMVTSRFPGHVEGQQKLVALLRVQADPATVQQALIQLALALRASGDEETAARRAQEAGEKTPLADEDRRLLERLGLLATAAVVDETAESDTSVVVDTPASVVEDDVEILFDDENVPAPSPGRKAPDDLLAEILELHQGGRLDDARRRFDALKTLGYGGTALDQLACELDGGSGERFRLADEELGEIAAAIGDSVEQLEQPLQEAATPEAGEESLAEVFDAFKRHVEEEVGTEDYQTHYDLGIGYKEMGLLDAAVEAFEVALRSPDLNQRAATMLAMCHREQGNTAEAVKWYQQALEGVAGPAVDLRYDLADALAQQGDSAAALTLFRQIHEAEPGYRDVGQRVEELQQQLGS